MVTVLLRKEWLIISKTSLWILLLQNLWLAQQESLSKSWDLSLVQESVVDFIRIPNLSRLTICHQLDKLWKTWLNHPLVLTLQPFYLKLNLWSNFQLKEGWTLQSINLLIDPIILMVPFLAMIPRDQMSHPQPRSQLVS